MKIRPEDSLTLAGMTNADAERAIAQADATAAMLTGLMRQPAKSISQAAGRIERESPLFFGTGDNPSLF